MTCPSGCTGCSSLPWTQLQEKRSEESAPKRRKSILLRVRTTDVFLFPSCWARGWSVHPRLALSALWLPHIPKGPENKATPNHTQELLDANSFHFYLEERLSWCYWNVSPLSRNPPERAEAPNTQMSPHLQGFHINFKCKWLHRKHQLPTQTSI